MIFIHIFLVNFYFNNINYLIFESNFYFWGFNISIFSQWIVFLRFLILFVIILSSIFLIQEKIFLIILIELRFLILFLFFSVESILNFYLFIELCLIPVFLIILGWGYQPERLNAGLWIFLYTLLSAIPFFLLFFFFMKKFYLGDFFLIHFILGKSYKFSVVFEWFFILGFLVKFPIYFFHIWLPRAHVEAPLLGSILLAAILLKLAGFGMIKFRELIIIQDLLNFIKFFCSRGGVLVRVICIFEKDIKKLIAYSSVGHIRFVILGLLIKHNLGLKGRFLFILTHGVRSSFLFLGSYLIYVARERRSLLLNFGFLQYWPIFTFFWFIGNLAGIRAPPRRRFFREIICILGRVVLNLNLIGGIGAILFLCVCYSIILYSMSQYGQRRNLRFYKIDLIRNLNLILHFFWVFLIYFILAIFCLNSILCILNCKFKGLKLDLFWYFIHNLLYQSNPFSQAQNIFFLKLFNKLFLLSQC